MTKKIGTYACPELLIECSLALVVELDRIWPPFIAL